ncbi:MAG TPA: chloride channel protein [Gallionellaceae bacterium]|nr:chloride channel protein [Gallionellaceae bacterium]
MTSNNENGSVSDIAKLWLAALIVGLLTAGALVVYHAAIHAIQWLLTQHTGSLVQDARKLPLWIRALVPAMGGLVAGLILDVGRGWTGGKPHIDYIDAAREGATALNDRTTAVRTLSSLFSIASGASIGREGPMVQISAWLASWLARLFPVPAAERNAILICGITSGIAAVYHAPIAGVVFALELALGFFSRHAIAPLILAAVATSALIFWTVEPSPLYILPVVPRMPVTGQGLAAALCVGAVSGLLGLFQLKMIEWAHAGFGRIRRRALRLGLGGIAVGLLSMVAPEVWGNGYTAVSNVLAGGLSWKWVAIVLCAKLLATVASTSSGAIGGIFTPTLFVGATSGYLFGVALGGVHMGGDQVIMAVIGMAAVLAAVTRAPLMAIVMVLEMTGQFQVTLHVMLACGVAYAISTRFRIKALYGNPIEHHS